MIAIDPGQIDSECDPGLCRLHSPSHKPDEVRRTTTQDKRRGIAASCSRHVRTGHTMAVPAPVVLPKILAEIGR